MSKIDYKSSGVDIKAGNDAVDLIKKDVKSTFTSNVLTGIGSFGSLFDLKPIINPQPTHLTYAAALLLNLCRYHLIRQQFY